jgi:multicomponent K+:H+ antiporter subunit F
MLDLAINIAFIMIALAMLLNLWRMLRGPDMADRILGLDTLYINSIALLVLYGLRTGSSAYFEIALLIAVLGFIGTVALCKYLLHGDILR